VHEWKPEATSAEQKARDILTAAMWLHTTFKNHIWLWRGQADGAYGVEPGMHSRVLRSSFPHDDATTNVATEALIKAARRVELDRLDGSRLPDLALLATLQHHGAATPLLDVTTDPLIALWMIAFADAQDPDRLDKRPGALFGLKRPPHERWIAPLDARPFMSREMPDVVRSVGDQVWWYVPPPVTDRIRTQRGSFLFGPLARPTERADTTLPFDLAQGGTNAIANRLARRGEKSNAAIGKVEIFRIVIPMATKPFLRGLLEERSGLSIEAIYPTPWHRPFIDQFSTAYGRGRPLELDIAGGTDRDRLDTVEPNDVPEPTAALEAQAGLPPEAPDRL
jgi:hypothetical protein